MSLQSEQVSRCFAALNMTRCVWDEKEYTKFVSKRTINPLNPLNLCIKCLPNNPQRTLINPCVTSQYLLFFHKIAAAGKVRDESAGFCNQHGAARYIPGIEPVFEKDIEATAGHVGQVEGCRTEAPHPAALFHKHPDGGKPAVGPFKIMIGKTGAHERLPHGVAVAGALCRAADPERAAAEMLTLLVPDEFG